MALDFLRARLGISIDDEVRIVHGTSDPSQSPGQSAERGSLYMQDTGSSGQLWIKSGDLDTDWSVVGTDAENGYQNLFVGKPSYGAVLPTYASNNYVTGATSMVDAISDLDAAIGPTVSGHYVQQYAGGSTGTVTNNLSRLDSQVYTNTQAIQAITTNITWRDPAYAITVDSYTNGQANPTTFSDDESVGGIGAAPEGSYIISSTQNAVYKVVSGNLVLQTIQDGFTYMVKHTLTNTPADQEKESIWTYSTNAFVKLADVNWQLATGINLSTGYAAAAATTARPAASDTIETAISKLDGRVGSNVTAGNYVLNTNTIGQNLQALDDALVTAPIRTKASNVTTLTTIDMVDVAKYEAVKWLVAAKSGNMRYASEIYAVTAGATGTMVDYTEYAQLYVRPKINGLTFSVGVTGNLMLLQAQSTVACNIGALRFGVDADWT